MKTRLLRLVHKASIFFLILVMAAVFLLALIRAEAPVVASELPTVTSFLSSVMGCPVQIESMELRWRRLLPVFDLHNVNIESNTPIQISEIKLGLHFILLRKFHLTLSTQSSSSGMTVDSSGYFNHIILEDAVIQVNQYQFTVERLDLHKRSGGFWSWMGDNIALDFGKLFIAPLKLSSTTGKIHVALSPNYWAVSLRNVAISNQDVFLLAKMDLSKQGDESPEMNLTARYEATSNTVANLKKYLPMTVLDPDVVNWLTHSIKSLKKGEGMFILKGKLSDFPFDKNPGEFTVDSEITEGVLDYFKNWPKAAHINTELIFSKNTMRARVHSAEIAHTPVQNIEVAIPALGKKSVLTISGNVSTDTSNGLYFIRNSPLEKSIGNRLANVQWTGPMLLGLQLQIPLSDKADPIVKGSINLKNTAVTLSLWNITVKNLTGLLTFSQNGVMSQKLTGIVSNAPVTISIDKDNIYHILYKKIQTDVTGLKNGGVTAKISSDAFKGMITVPPNPKQNGIKGLFYFLNVSADDMSGLIQNLKPSTLPPLNMIIQNLRYKSIRFNALNFQTQNLPNGLMLRNFQIDGPHYSIVGQGKWLDSQQSILEGKLESNDLVSMIRSWGLDPSIHGNAGEVMFSLNWPGVIYSPDLKRMSGTMNITVGKGQMITSSSQAKMNFGRLLSLLSFSSIERRLTLDFSDFTQKGLGFDSINGVIVFNHNGLASVKNLIMKSAVAQVEIKGSLNIILETYNLDVMVIPHLTSSLPVVATIAGGPVAGAAVWAASKVVSPLINKVTEDHYTVLGPWHEPVIKKG